MERIALVGFVNTEEVVADTIKRQSPRVQVDGFELFPNDAFGRAVDTRTQLYHFTDGELVTDMAPGLDRIRTLGYTAVNVGPDVAVMMTSEALTEEGIAHIGSTPQELEMETDKTKIAEIFPESTGILPATRVLEAADLHDIDRHIEELGGRVVTKFVGAYNDYYDDSEYRRIRLPNEFESPDDFRNFLANSVDASGQVILQQYIEGQQFSHTCIVDQNGNVFPLGENIFYKNRFEGDKGPFCDGAGSVSINNTLPDIMGAEDKAFIRRRIVEPYLAAMDARFRRSPRAFLNIDLVKGHDGRIYLLEINNRQPGGHTMATLLPGLHTPLAEILQAAQEDRLHDLTPRYKSGSSVVVTIFPERAPNDFSTSEQRPIMRIPKLRPEEQVRHYTGWVDVLDETETAVTVQSNLTATLIVNNHAPTIREARSRVYSKVIELATEGFAYRSDIADRYM